jgi:hypothetical protein
MYWPSSGGRGEDFGVSDNEATYRQWVPVIGRSLAYLCIQAGELKDKSLADKAAFLEATGIERKDVATMLGTTYGSVNEALSKVRRAKKGEKNKRGRKG